MDEEITSSINTLSISHALEPSAKLPNKNFSDELAIAEWFTYIGAQLPVSATSGVGRASPTELRFALSTLQLDNYSHAVVSGYFQYTGESFAKIELQRARWSREVHPGKAGDPFVSQVLLK